MSAPTNVTVPEPVDEEPVSKVKTRLERFLSHPVAGAIAWILTVAAIPLSIYLYLRPPEHRDLCYLVNSEKTVIVREGQLSRLNVTLDGKAIGSDVSAAQVAFWNDGNKAIRSEHVLEPLLLRTQPSVPIIDATIRKTSRTVIHPKIDTAGFSQGVLGLSWDILEESDGAALQVVFAGGTHVDLVATTVLEGQASIRRIDVKAPPPKKRVEALKVVLIGMLWILCLSSFVLVFARRRSKEHVEHMPQRRLLLDLLLIAISLGGALFVTTDFLASHPRLPPFGF